MELSVDLPWAIRSATFVAVASFVALMFRLSRRRDPISEERLREFFEDRAPKDADTRLARMHSGRLAKMLLSRPLPRWCEHLLPDGEAARSHLQNRLIHAGMYHRSTLFTYCVCKIMLMVAPPILGLCIAWAGWVSFNLALLYGAIVGVFGVFIPGLWLDWRKAGRQRRLRRSLADYLDLLTACLEGGTGIQAVMMRVTDELRTAHPLLAGEMSMVQREIDLGCGTSEALLHLAQRCDLDEFRSLATFVSHAERFGTTMSDALRELSEMLRFQRENRAEEAAHKASVKILAPTLLFIFPAVFVVLAGPAAIKLQSAFKVAPKTAPKVELSPRPVTGPTNYRGSSL